MNNLIERAERERKIYTALVREFRGDISRGIPPTRVLADNISKGTLRQDLELSNTQNEYVFDFNRSTGSNAPYERKLLQNDMFVVTDMQIGLVRERVTEPGTGIFRTYPNVGEFGPQARHLESIFNGYSEIQVNDTIVATGLSNLVFKYVPANARLTIQDITTEPARFNPQTQPTGPDTEPTRQQEHFAANLDEFEFGYGLFACEPLLELRGDQTNSVKVRIANFQGLNIAAPVATPPNPQFSHRLVAILHGYTVFGVNSKLAMLSSVKRRAVK